MARIGQAEFGYPVVVGTVVRDLASRGVSLSRRTRPSNGAGYATGSAGIVGSGAALHTANSCSVVATGSTDRAVSGFAGRAGSGGVYFSRTGGRGGPLGAGKS